MQHLKIFQGDTPGAAPRGMSGIGSLPGVLRAFEKTTGHKLRYQHGPNAASSVDLTWSSPVNPGDGLTPGHLSLEPMTRSGKEKPTAPPNAVRELASSLGGMIEELLRTQHTLWQREGELATGAPETAHADDLRHFAETLGAILEGGARSIGCHAVALYLLDDATSQLKLRSGWGLPADRMLDPPRRLQRAMADLEAMLGHAVVLDNDSVAEYWNPPEDFAASVCVPVSSPKTIMGTLWFFSNDNRGFSDQEVCLAETVAGRIAADLEREAAIRQRTECDAMRDQLAAAERMQRNQLPSIAPILDGWDIAGWTAQAHGVGGDFFDWFSLSNGMVTVAVADVMDQSLEAAIATSALKAAVRSHGQYQRSASGLLEHVNLTMWTASAGDLFANMFCGMVDTSTGDVHYALAGRPTVIHVQENRWQSLSQAAEPLGRSPETAYDDLVCRPCCGEAIVVVTDGVRDALSRQGTAFGEKGIAKSMAGKLAHSAKDLVAAVRTQLQRHADGPLADDCTVLVIRRTESR